MPELQQYHSQLIRLGLSHSPTFTTPLTHTHPDTFFFNTLIQSLPSHLSTLLYSHMLHLSLHPNTFTFPSLLKPITHSRDLALGLQVHAHILKLGFHTNIFAQNNLINMYLACTLPASALRVFDTMLTHNVVSWTTLVTGFSRLGMLDAARDLFDEMPDRNSVSWNVMIAGYVRSGRFGDAFELFDRMLDDGIALDKFVSATMLLGCIGVGTLERGEWIHGCIERSGIEMDSKLATTVIDMYCKCGCLEKAYEVFARMPLKGVASWNCMIGGFATHGRGEAAIEMFEKMERELVVPDGITLLNVLTACAHTGLVDAGRHYFKHMVEAYGIEPKMEHFGCLVDLLGRAGLLDEAKKIIDKMPMDPDAGVLGALAGACKIHGNVDLGEEIGRRVIELDPQNSGRYVLLANLLSSASRWDDAAEVRRLMNDRGVDKGAGHSMIEFNGVVNEFIAGGMSHPQAREIYAKVEEMLHRIRTEGYIPDIEGVLHDIDDVEKENPLFFHSEKLAIAFGLLHTERGETIRITKNLRVCKDCHAASKLVSWVYGREIVLRDRSRFHHFKGGECSCKDYW